MKEKPAIGIFGAGWVGLVTGACFAELGHRVIIRDIVPERIEALSSGVLPFHEDGLAELVQRNRERLLNIFIPGEGESVVRDRVRLRRILVDQPIPLSFKAITDNARQRNGNKHGKYTGIIQYRPNPKLR